MFCEQCGSKVEDGVKFCPNCGASIIYDTSVQQSEQVSPPPAGNVQHSVPVPPPVYQQNYQQGPGSPVPPNAYQYQNGRQMPPRNAKKKSPVGCIIIIVILVAVIAGIIFGISILKKKVKNALAESGLGEAVNILGGASSDIKIPDGASPVEGANVLDLVGKYEGEIQITKLEGMEKMPGAEEHMDMIKERVETALSAPSPCTLEIEDDGRWTIGLGLFEGMEMSSHDLADKDEDPTAYDLFYLNSGSYDIIKSQSKADEGDNTTGSLEHAGVYCEKDGENLIAGFVDFELNKGGAKIHMRGDFVVNKTTGDYVPEGGEEVYDIMNGSDSSDDEDGYSGESDFSDSGDESNISGGGDDFGDTDDFGTDGSSSGKTDSFDDDSSGGSADTGGIKSVDTPDPSKTALTGGKWDVLQSGEFQYIKDGKAVENTWAEDEGGYYYIGPDGCLVRNNYAPDGYWADDNGCWDKSVPRQELQFEPYNNDYVGHIRTFEIRMDDAYTGSAKVYYTNNFGGGEPKKTDFRIERLGISSYAAYSEVNEYEIYLLSVTDDGWGLIVSCDGDTEKCSIE